MRKLWLIIVFIIVGFSFYYTYSAYTHQHLISGKYKVKIVDSVLITDGIIPCNYYFQNGYWIKIGMGMANFYEINGSVAVLKTSIKGTTTTQCPNPNKRISPKKLERARFFAVGKNIILTYDDINERFYIFDKNGNLIRNLKTELTNKKLVTGCNYSQTNDTIVVIPAIDMYKSNIDSLIFSKSEPLYYIVHLSTGKILHTVGSFPEIYQTKKYLSYLPFHTFTTDFKQKRIFYQCEGSPFIYVSYWGTGKNEVFGVPCQNYTYPQFEISQSAMPISEYVSKTNEYRDKSYIANNIYYEPNHDYIFRDFRLPKEKDGIRNYILQVYQSNNLITEVLLEKRIGNLVYVSKDLDIWFEKNRLPNEVHTVLYKTKLVPDN